MRFLFVCMCSAAALFAQTGVEPVRAVTDPGVVTTRQNITPAGVQMVFQGRVYGLAFGATSSELWVLNAGRVFRIDLHDNRVLQRVPVPGAPGLQGIRYDGAAGRILLTAAVREKGDSAPRVRLFTIEKGGAEPVGSALGGHLSGALAVAPHLNARKQRLAVVPVIPDNKLAVVDLVTGQVLSPVDTGKAPFAAVIDRAGSVAYVSNWGGRTPTAADLTAPTGLRPGSDRVVVDERGIASTGTVTRIDLASGGAATHTVVTGLHPTAMVWDEDNERLYVANGNEDSIAVIDTRRNSLLRTFSVNPFAGAAAGIAPTALALAPGGERLYVACGGINAVAVLSTESGRIEGLIPTAWYPNGLSLSPDGKYLGISTLLGAGSGFEDSPRRRFVHSYRGSVAAVPLPDAAQLAAYTAAVANNNRLPLVAPATAPPGTGEPAAIPAHPGQASLIEHVVYIIKENRTYDQVLGDIGKGNGDPSLVMFGAAITPNQHRLAGDFVLLDNFYATGGNSGDGHQWLTQANETDYAMWPGYTGRSYPFDGTDPIAYSKSGFIWDAAQRANKTVRVYGEYAGRLDESSDSQRADLLARWKRGDTFTGDWHTVAPLQPLNAILQPKYPPYSTAVPDVVRAQIFLDDLKQWVRAGRMPDFVILQLPSNHTRGTSPGASTPNAMVADNDLALGQIVEALTRTEFWRKMAIFVVEDDAQDGVDHVDGHRTVALAVSPYTHRAYVDSTFYSHPSMLKTIELILGLQPLSLFDQIAEPLRAAFVNEPDYSPYSATTPRASLFEVNPPLSALSGSARRAAMDSKKMRFESPDAAPSGRLNRILWHSVRGWSTRYPGSKRAAFAPLSVDLDDDERK